MSAYTTRLKLRAFAGDRGRLTQLLDMNRDGIEDQEVGSDSDINQLIEDASATIDASISAPKNEYRYAVPLSDPPPGIIVTIANHLVSSMVYSRWDTRTHEVPFHAEAAKNLLRQISRGDVGLPGASVMDDDAVTDSQLAYSADCPIYTGRSGL